MRPVKHCIAEVICALVLLATASPRAAELAELDRQRLVAHLEVTASWLVDEVSTLSRAQLDFRAAADTWSIMEVVEHLIVAGAIYWEDLQKAVQTAPSKPVPSSGDADILWYGIDRTHRETAIPAERPKRELRDLPAALGAYRKQHARLLHYAKSTKDDLRRRFVARQGCDGYQWALLISTHEQRHILQIREIKAEPRFPKK